MLFQCSTLKNIENIFYPKITNWDIELHARKNNEEEIRDSWVLSF